MDTQKYICEKCGANHPTEAHENIVMMNLTNPDYLPSRQEVLDVLKPDLYDSDDSRKERMSKHREIIQMGHEILNQEFIETFANYLTSRIAQYQKDEPVIILELGAGNGRLARFLKEKLSNTVPYKFEYVATNLKDGKYDRRPAFQVEEIDYKEALKKYNPTIVITSWMPYRHDWTSEFRATPSVQEYILIGEQASTGDAWLTWGDPSFQGRDWEKRFRGVSTPAEADGFEERYLEEVSEQQIKSPTYVTQIEPVTYSFRRVSK